MRAKFGVPGAARRTLLPDHRFPIFFHKCKMEVGRHLHRPPIVERPNNDGGRVAQVGEGVLAPNPDLTLLTHAAQESGEPDRRVDIPRRYAVVSVFHHFTPDQLVLRMQG